MDYLYGRIISLCFYLTAKEPYLWTADGLYLTVGSNEIISIAGAKVYATMCPNKNNNSKT